MSVTNGCKRGGKKDKNQKMGRVGLGHEGGKKGDILALLCMNVGHEVPGF